MNTSIGLWCKNSYLTKHFYMSINVKTMARCSSQKSNRMELMLSGQHCALNSQSTTTII